MGQQVTRQAKKMVTRKITIMMFIAGTILGAATTEGFNVYRQSHDSQVFQERARCKAVADAYVKATSTDFKEDSTAQSGVAVTLDKVDYSPARNSCVAELQTIYFTPPTGILFDSVQDLLSGETLFSVSCTGTCVEEFQKTQFVDPAFDYVMKNADEPRDLEKAYVDVQSVLKSKTQSQPAPPSGNKEKWDRFQIDPATGEPIQVPKYPPESANPSGR
jgi:hypothetical protein